MTTIRYLTAAEWGMRWARPPQTETRPDPECYVHHTGGEMPGDAIAAFRRLNEYAISGKGYSAVDYDVLVHYDPAGDVLTIGEGRGPWMSAATLDRNEPGEAVCIVGNFELRVPYPIEVEGVALGIVYGIDNGWISRDAAILGHRDNPAHPGATACPGSHLYAQLPTIRARVARLIESPTEEGKTMKVIRHGRHGAAYKTDGLIKVWLDNGNVAAAALAMCGQTVPEDVDADTCAAYGPIVGPIPQGHDAYGRVVG